MTTPVRYQPIGPVRIGEDVVLAIKANGVLYVATYDSSATIGTNSIVENVVFFPLYTGTPARINPIITNLTLLVFKVDGTPDSISMTVKTPSSIAGYSLTVDRLRPGTVNDPLFRLTLVEFSQSKMKLTSKYSNPPLGYSLFSSVDYKFFSPGNLSSNAFPIYRPPSNPNSQAINTSIFTIAAAYHEHTHENPTLTTCTSGAEDPLGALNFFYCSDRPNSGVCQNANVVAWTRISDCQRAIEYDYCLTGETCGVCLGSCGTGTNQCVYVAPNSQRDLAMNINNNKKIFVCTGPDAPLTPANDVDKPWYEQVWFVALIIIIVVIALLVMGYYVMKKRNSQPVITHKTNTVLNTMTGESAKTEFFDSQR